MFIFIGIVHFYIWGYSSVGRAPALQAGGQEFESLYLHHTLILIRVRYRFAPQYMGLGPENFENCIGKQKEKTRCPNPILSTDREKKN